jgi:hypothetical protein
VQEVSGIRELVGSDVNLIHRLMKNHITENTGWTAYILFTNKAFEHMDVHPDGLHEQLETYEHLGDVQTLSVNLLERYQAILEASHIVIMPEEADFGFSYKFDAPPAIIWNWLTDVEKKNLIAEGEAIFTPRARPNGRNGPGAANHCAHGKNLKGSLIETVLDWRPFDYFTSELVEGKMKMRQMYRLEPLASGSKTRLHLLATAISPSLPRLVRRLIMKTVFSKAAIANCQAIESHLAQEGKVELSDETVQVSV